VFSHRHLELLDREHAAVVRILRPRPMNDQELAEVVAEWNAIADRPDCQTFVIDCSRVQLLSSRMLSRFVVLQRRMARKGGKLILRGLQPSVREILGRTRLDRFFEIEENVADA
jgi:anti-anti-sigma factor